MYKIEQFPGGHDYSNYIWDPLKPPICSHIYEDLEDGSKSF